MLYPRSGTATSLGSIAIVTSYLKTTYPRSTVLWISPLHLPFTDPPSHLPPWNWSAPLFVPDFTPSFRSWTACPNKHTLPLASISRPALNVLLPWTYSPGLCWTLQPCNTIPLLLPCHPLVASILLPLTLLASMSTPLGSPFWVTTVLRHFSNQPSPWQPQPRDRSLPVLRGFVPPDLVSCIYLLFYLFTCSCAVPYIDVFWELLSSSLSCSGLLG